MGKHTIQWPNEKGQNDTQYNGQMKKDKWGSCNSNDTIQWPIHDTQYNGQMKKDKWGSCNSNDMAK